MIFFLNLDGTMQKASEERIFQGSAGANKISVITPFLPPVALQIAFTLPNGIATVYYPMLHENSYEPAPEQQGITIGLWSYDLPLMITENAGKVLASINAIMPKTDGTANRTSYSGEFTVEYSVLPTPPENPQPSDVETLVELLNRYYAQNKYLIDYKLSFKVVGSVTTVAGLPKTADAGTAYFVGTTPPRDVYVYDIVTKTWVNQGVIEGPPGPKGKDGENWSLDLAYPIGSFYMSTVATSPASIYGGTWEQKQGRMLIGVGTETDANGTQRTFTARQTGGNYTHALSVNEMPSHNHSPIHVAGGNTNNYTFGIFDKNNNAHKANVFGISNEILYQDFVTDDTSIVDSNIGGNQAFDNLPPYLAVYIWERVA